LYWCHIRAELPDRREEIVRFFTNPGEVPGNNRRICYTDRVYPEKGIEQLAGAVGLLRKSDPQWKLLVVGHTDVGLKGGGEPYMQRIIDAASSKDAVECTGGVRDPKILANHIRSCRYYCYSSLARKGEACPVAPLEALAAGVPPIVSDLDQFLDYIKPDVNGITVTMEPEGAEQRLAEVIRALDKDTERYARLSKETATSAQ
jgi:glycosyltransferase involved in cell wall biosynthesis